MNELVVKALKNKATRNIFYELLKKPGLSVTELAKILKKKQPTISDQMDILEKAGLVKIKVNTESYMIKLYYPTLKPFFEPLSEMVDFTEEDYKNIDNFLLDPTIKEYVFELSKNINNIIVNLTSVIFKVFSFITSEEFENMIKKNDDLKEKYEKFLNTINKIKFLKLTKI